jgi:hypothetical protein
VPNSKRFFHRRCYRRPIDDAAPEVEHPRAQARSRRWAAVSTIAFGLCFAGFMTINIDGPTIVLAIVAPFVGLITGVVAVVVAVRHRESLVWPLGSLVLNFFPAAFWTLVVLVASTSFGS